MKKLFFLFFLSSFLLTGCALFPEEEGEFDEFAKCLNSTGAKMYGTEWCGHCKDQKERFGISFQHVDYIDCDKTKQVCTSAGIKGYPTWIIDGEAYPGARQLSELAELSGCELE